MMKRSIIIIILFFSATSFAQQEQAYQHKIDSLKVALESVKQKGNVTQEISLMYQIFVSDMKNVEYNQAYADGLILEELLLANKENDYAKNLFQAFYSNMGWLLSIFSEYEKGIDYYKKAISLAEKDKIKNETNISVYKGSIAFYSILLGRNKEAHDIVDELMREAEAKKNEDLISLAHYHYSCIFHEEGNLEMGLYHIKKTKPGPTDGDKAFRLINIGSAYLKINELDSALVYTIDGLKFAEKSKDIQIQSNAHIQLKDIYIRIKNYEKAVDHMLKYEAMLGENNSFRSGKEYEKINSDIIKEKYTLQEQLDAERISNQKTIIWINVIAIIILTLGLFFIIKKLKLIRKQNKIIAQEKARAEQSEKYKEQFLANMSHEIRTPMHAISGMINSLERNPHPKHQNKFLDAMKTSSDNLMSLLNDILDLSKISSGKLEIERIDMNPLEVVNNVVKTLKYKAKEKGLELHIEIEDNFPERIIGDPSRLNQILINLVGNAIKFTDQGSVTIQLSRTNGFVLFAIKDTGLGISKEKLDYIFEVFVQGEKSKSQIFGGTGLGLSISKQLVELQNGKIWVESDLGRGSTFFVQFPIDNKVIEKELKPVFFEETQLKSLGELMRGISVLLVEDDDFNIMVVKDDLNYFIPDIKIMVVKNGQEALKKLESESFDVILMDKHMPIMNGCESSKKIRELERKNQLNKRIPIIAMTASLLKSEIDECLASGMDSYIPKPYNPVELITTVYNNLIK